MPATTIKLQKIGNSLRGTIPKEAARALSLKRGDDMAVIVSGDSVVFKKKQQGAKDFKSFYGILKDRTGEVEHWPTTKEIKSIWE